MMNNNNKNNNNVNSNNNNNIGLHIPPIMENHMEKQMENEMEAAVYSSCGAFQYGDFLTHGPY